MESFVELDENGNPQLNSSLQNSSSLVSRFKPFNPDFWVAMFENNAFAQTSLNLDGYIPTDNAVSEQFEDVGEASLSLFNNKQI